MPANVPLPTLLTACSRRGLLTAASIATIAAAGLAPRYAVARQGDLAATPTAEMATFYVQFIHFEKLFSQFGFTVTDEQIADMYGIDVPTLQAIRQTFANNARQAAEELLAESDFAARVDQLPFAPGDVVIGAADSITDDLQSWLEILRYLLELRRPGDGIQVVNQGISGDTTADVLRRFSFILAGRPAWIICFLGTNDAGRNGRGSSKTLVSLEETAANLDELRHVAATAGVANWAWITPPPCDEAVIAASPYAADGAFSLRNDDLRAIAEVTLAKPEPVVDLFALFGEPPAPDLMLPDGIHPNLAGQQAIARAVVERLTG